MKGSESLSDCAIIRLGQGRDWVREGKRRKLLCVRNRDVLKPLMVMVAARCLKQGRFVSPFMVKHREFI